MYIGVPITLFCFVLCFVSLYYAIVVIVLISTDADSWVGRSNDVYVHSEPDLSSYYPSTAEDKS